jgi:hypothetical protein
MTEQSLDNESHGGVYRHHCFVKERSMGIESMLAAIDREIENLQKARAILLQVRESSTGNYPAAKPRRKRKLSKEARAKIAAAQRRRWAAQKKAKK